MRETVGGAKQWLLIENIEIFNRLKTGGKK